MKTVRTIHRTTKFALQNFWRNIWLTFATILVFTLTLITINILIVLNQIAHQAIESVEDQIDVSVYFEQGTTEEIIFGAQDYLLSLAQVEDVRYVSADDAYVSFSQRHRNNPEILRALDTVELNPFGGELVVTAVDPNNFDFILEALNNPTFGDSIKQKDFTDHKQVIAKIESFTERAMIVIYILAGIFAFIASLIVLNSIRVSIYTHREEIGIMKLVGANNSFVRLPFIIEAILMSLVATGLTVALVLPVLQIIEPSISNFFTVTSIGLYDYYIVNWLPIFVSQFVGLAILATMASALALSRYLRF